MPNVFTTRSEDHTIALGEAIGRALWPGDVLAIEGELGAGKTRLVRGVCRGMGLDESLVSSPTFVLVNHYPAPTAGTTGLYHVDAYRLHGSDELDAVGWDRVMDGSSVVAIEWASKLGDPRDWIPPAPSTAKASLCEIALRHAGSSEERAIRIDAPASWASRPEWRAVLALADTRAPASSSARCPVCGSSVRAEAADAPFCSQRCKMADLNKWLSGSYVVSRELTEDDFDDLDEHAG